MTSRRAFPRVISLSAALLLPLSLSGCDDKADGAKTPAKKPPATDRSYDGGAAEGGDAPSVDPAALLARVKPILQPLPKNADNPDNPQSDAKVALGSTLYFENRISKNHDLSCNSCHVLSEYGIDPRQTDGKRNATSLGHKNQVGERNSPTVYNAALHIAQFWDGRAADVEEQAKGPVLNPVEMAMADEKSVVAVLASIPAYEKMFADAFPDSPNAITYDNMAKAIGAFERTLLTPAPFDKFLGGELSALDATQLRGLELFLDVGCTQCHVGSMIGGNQFQKLGSVKPWPTYKDEGRMTVTSTPADKYVFKVPSLRNVAKTGPYLHDGSITDLSEVVRLMAEHQTARGKLEDDETKAIVSFLDALTGELPKDRIVEPKLPPSGPKTPSADPS